MIPINGWIRKIVEWTIIIVIAVFGFVMSIKGTMNDVTEMKPMVRTHETKIAILENDIKYIKQGIDEIKSRLK